MSNVGRTGYNPITHPSYTSEGVKRTGLKKAGSWAATIAANILTLGGAYIVTRGLQYKKICKEGDPSQGKVKYLSKNFIKFLFSKPAISPLIVSEQPIPSAPVVQVAATQPQSDEAILKEAFKQLKEVIKDETRHHEVQLAIAMTTSKNRNVITDHRKTNQEFDTAYDRLIGLSNPQKNPVPKTDSEKAERIKEYKQAVDDLIKTLEKIEQPEERASEAVSTEPPLVLKRKETQFSHLEPEMMEANAREVRSLPLKPSPLTAQFNRQFEGLKDTFKRYESNTDAKEKASLEIQLSGEKDKVVKYLHSIEGWLKAQEPEINFDRIQISKLENREFIQAVEELKQKYDF